MVLKLKLDEIIASSCFTAFSIQLSTATSASGV